MQGHHQQPVTVFAAVPAGSRRRDAKALTARERTAIMLVAEGKTDWEIGIILGFSANTARFHVDNARRKLDAVSRAHAVARFILSGGYAAATSAACA